MTSLGFVDFASKQKKSTPLLDLQMAYKEEDNKFSLEIEKLASEKSISHIDAIILYCERTGLEIELTAKLINSTLKTKIKIEAEKLNYLPKPTTNKLPV